jgi:hypothetical protein
MEGVLVKDTACMHLLRLPKLHSMVEITSGVGHLCGRETFFKGNKVELEQIMTDNEIILVGRVSFIYHRIIHYLRNMHTRDSIILHIPCSQTNHCKWP